ncbi:hypothetical protein [Persicitalea jodogahamensis]|uniref:Uncharacterized protein n=1 Tax=Persicitalea jodogahamensis TaxID=402147 RepID=A0A8J3G8I3_9BACT|nr:hypothetical protein [Persicitalea jodogahamensis]GHB55372.1 hypothetical protein GCM10007390_05730 [Persicitalea jodogahamensis]
MKSLGTLLIIIFLASYDLNAQSQTPPDAIQFVRQGVRRLVFDQDQAIPLAVLNPAEVVGMSAMYPVDHELNSQASVTTEGHQLVIQSEPETRTGIWFCGFNPFATYTLDLASSAGQGEIGFEFSDAKKENQFFVTVVFANETITGAHLRVLSNQKIVADESIALDPTGKEKLHGRLILQMLGSGLNLYVQNDGLPLVIGQSDFNKYLDLRKKECLQSFQSKLFVQLNKGKVVVNSVASTLSTGNGLADIRAITYENGDPYLDRGRLWYTMSIRGRALPHHVQGIFSLDPTVFDLKLEGIVVFDRNDGLLRNEIASHIFYDRPTKLWRGLTTGFSAYANIDKEKKQLLAIESQRDPRFGFSVMHAEPFGMVGDIEDPHILFDSTARKWRMLTCENQKNGYKAIVLESDFWNKGYTKIAGPVSRNSTGTSVQKIGDKRYCFSGSSEREIYIYTYPDLKEAGTLKMDLPPWDAVSGTRVWPNVVQLPPGYPFRYVALMMDRFNYPGLKGPHWTYGAVYLYHGYD